jgi:hypothetical protein
MANRERAYSLSGPRIDLGKWKALSFGYFSLGKQRKVTRAPQAIGSLAGDSSLLCLTTEKAWKAHGWCRHSAAQKRPAFAGMTSNSNSNSDSNSNSNSKVRIDSSCRWNDGEVVRRHRSAHSLRAWIPAFAGMTVVWFAVDGVPNVTGLRPGFRRDDAVCFPSVECPTVHAWVAAFARMTVVWFAVDGVPERYAPGCRLSPG